MISSRHSIKEILNGVLVDHPIPFIGLRKSCSFERFGFFTIGLKLLIGMFFTSKSKISILFF